MLKRSRILRVIPYTFRKVRQVITFLVVRWLVRVIVAVLWQGPAQVWGGWVVLGGYGLALGFLAVVSDLLAVERWLAYSILWGFLASWRWNLARLRQGVRPLFERREDL
jgi:hypothetical protein